MPTTTAYGWATPADTDPVRDGALAIRTLAQAIDDQLNATGIAGYREQLVDLGDVSATVTLDLATANVWRINPTAAVDVALANLPAAGTAVPITLLVANSLHAVTWPVGTTFPGGSAPLLDGETWLSGVVRSTGLTVGAAWSAVA